MTATRALRGLTGVLVLGLLGLGAAPAHADDPVAVLTEIRPGSGEVRVKGGGAADWTPARVLQALRPGDQLRVTGDGRATVVLPGGRPQVVTAASSPFTVGPPPAAGATDRARSAVSGVTQFLLGQRQAPTYQSLSVRAGGPVPVRILVPRDSRVLPDTVTFEWSGPPRADYRLEVSRPGGETVWAQAGLARRPVPYPAWAAPLQPGARYRWTVALPDQPVQSAEFEIAPAAESARVQRALGDLGAGAEGSTGALLRAGLLFQEGFFADARRELVGAIAADPDEPTLRLLLGYVYDRLGLKELAAREFDEAEYLATRRP
jgi:hypothetical protein